MASVPRPAFLQIRGLDNEMAIARCSTEKAGLFVRSVEKLVQVRVQWRQAERDPTLISTLSEIPPAPRSHDFEVMRRDDGTYTLVTNQLRTFVDPKATARGEPTLYELTRQARRPLRFSPYLEYGSNLIKQYRPDFDYSRSEEEANLLLHTLKRINKVRESVEDLQNYLWYSDADKTKAIPPVKDPQRDIRAAVLQDGFGLNTFRVGEVLGFDPPSDLERQRKRELAAVRVAAQRGRELLHYYFGADEWRQKAQRIRTLRALWIEFDEGDQVKKQVYYLLAERHGTTLEEEEAAATQDGFDQLLDEWISARLCGDDQRALSLLDRDSRFEEFITQF